MEISNQRLWTPAPLTDPSRVVLGLNCGPQLVLSEGEGLQRRWSWNLTAFRTLAPVVSHHGVFVTAIEALCTETLLQNTSALKQELKGKFSRIVLHSWSFQGESRREVFLGNVGAVVHIMTGSYLHAYASVSRAWTISLREWAGIEVDVNTSLHNLQLALAYGVECDFDQIVVVNDLQGSLAQEIVFMRKAN